MSQEGRAMALAQLVEAYAVKDMTTARARLYSAALEKAEVSDAVLVAAVDALIQTEPWFPKIADLLAACERVRRERIAQMGGIGCVECEDSKGWVAEQHADGIRMVRCGCWRRYQASVSALGPAIRQLPRGSDDAYV